MDMNEGMVRFMLGLVAIWSSVICFGPDEHPLMQVALCSAGILTLWAFIKGKIEIYIKKLRNWTERVCYYWKFWWISVSHAVFMNQKDVKERYDTISKALSEYTIQQWIMDELQQEVWRQGVDIAFKFSNADEAEKRLKWIAESTDFYTTEAVETYLREDYPHRLAETVAREFFPLLCVGEPLDLILFFPQNIKKKWRIFDFAHTFAPRCVVRAIVRHEVRHYMQYMELRRTGGSSFVEYIKRRSEWLPYGLDVMESDAFRYQFDNDRSIDAFLEEALIEAA